MKHEISTIAVHAGDDPQSETGALEPPLVLATTFAFEDAADAQARVAGDRPGYVYGRWRNPTCEALEHKLAALEGAEACVVLASGMAAVYGALTTALRAGDHVIAPKSVYAETSRLLRDRLARFGITTTFVDMTRTSDVRDAMQPSTRVVWTESPANPNLDVTDLEAVARIAHEGRALCMVDNTFATPYHQRPLELGADLVVHATTKAISGHGDAVGGAVLGSAERVGTVRDEMARGVGAVMSPFVAFLVSRGAKTLALRQAQSSASALELARRLTAHPAIEHVFYPGLPSHRGHELAKRQMRRGFGSLLAFEIRGGLDAGRNVYDRVALVARAVSLGDTRSLLTHAATTTHASMPSEARAAAGIGEGLMRLSVGIEDVEDLWRDLAQALERAAP